MLGGTLEDKCEREGHWQEDKRCQHDLGLMRSPPPPNQKDVCDPTSRPPQHQHAAPLILDGGERRLLCLGEGERGLLLVRLGGGSGESP